MKQPRLRKPRVEKTFKTWPPRYARLPSLEELERLSMGIEPEAQKRQLPLLPELNTNLEQEIQV